MLETSFKIHSLYCGLDKGFVEARNSLLINENGVVDDYHQDKQIILLDLDTYNSLNQNKDNALCMSKFYAHIIIDKKIEFNLEDQLFHNNLKLRVIQCGKRCHMHEGCEYFKQNYDCILSKNTFYLTCESNGEININEEWGDYKMYRYAVIISSDKGSQNLRVDGGIPTIQKCMLNEPFEMVYSVIVPDEIDKLQAEILHSADELKVDLVLISGGTGFSVRDVTPEALYPLLDKHTPGISEAIRAYSMTITKKAMLSRAISGIRKETLFITLPGSPKAVEESLLYILEPLKHGLDILIGSAQECASKD